MNYSRRNILSVNLILLLSLGNLFPGLSAGLRAAEEGVRVPDSPSEPTVTFRNATDRIVKADFSATVTTAAGERMSGSLSLLFSSLKIEINEDGKSRIKNVELSDIESIEFTRWRGVERRKNEFTFYPVGVRITLSDKKVIECGRNLPQLNKMLFKDSRGTRSLYSYFYEYRKDNVWLASGQAEMDYPETNPLGSTVVRIIFTEKGNASLLEQLFFRK